MGPDIKYLDREDNSLRPSWSVNPGYVNDLHREIYARTDHIPGWQMEGDTYKLFEMGYFCGDVILEIGIYAGRSASVALHGALSNPGRKAAPQYFGVDIDPNAIKKTRETLTRQGLIEYAMILWGGIEMVTELIDITPTMVFVDGDHSYEGCKKDLYTLNELLSANTPVLCHDWKNKQNQTGEYGVLQACNEWEQDGYAHFAGVFGCSALYITSDKCNKVRGALTARRFRQLRDAVSENIDEAIKETLQQN
ncbi:MAG: class I SAM-dependent methyltransferase [Candidatus Dadabacteria bacterium]|nr:MAG: class I SAM-dependent methyltransferase [Candidatus Dadabacteria bacterium]